ncbi:MAG TPA: hypothetical protein DCM40_17035 [Maribacter sp.]|jgi:predicted CopG family antitoxin|nr:hypothetical protein [Maribacter sp.]|tara:strand:- start:2095 stop:2319 length:225 start_codon:yes stop_codon:yes gene_type:complete
MASLDNIYEIADRLKDDNIDYFIVAIQKGKKKDDAEVLYRLSGKDSIEDLKTVLHRLDIEGAVQDSKNPDEDDS